MIKFVLYTDFKSFPNTRFDNDFVIAGLQVGDEKYYLLAEKDETPTNCLMVHKGRKRELTVNIVGSTPEQIFDMMFHCHRIIKR